MSESDRVFELRIYHCTPGARDLVVDRFRQHTIRIFARHGITVEGFWTPMVDDNAEYEDLLYVCSFPSREAAEASWESFKADPEWKEVVTASMASGASLVGLVSTYMVPTDFSPMR